MAFERLFSWSLASLALLCALAPTAQAVAIYEYQGTGYTFFLGPYDASMSIQIELRFANPLAPNLVFENVAPDLGSFGYFDGVQGFALSPFDPADFSEFFLRVSTDANGDIDGWNIRVTEAVTIGRFESVSFGQDRTLANGGLVLAASAIPGTWTFVPEPGSGVLVGMGLAAVGCRRRGVSLR